jgi:hypothetical protein
MGKNAPRKAEILRVQGYSVGQFIRYAENTMCDSYVLMMIVMYPWKEMPPKMTNNKIL